MIWSGLRSDTEGSTEPQLHNTMRSCNADKRLFCYQTAVIKSGYMLEQLGGSHATEEVTTHGWSQSAGKALHD
jgi:hypothetical protein